MSKKVKAFNNVLELIGNTPLVKLNKIVEEIPGDFYAKVEALILVILIKIELHFI